MLHHSLRKRFKAGSLASAGPWWRHLEVFMRGLSRSADTEPENVRHKKARLSPADRPLLVSMPMAQFHMPDHMLRRQANYDDLGKRLV